MTAPGALSSTGGPSRGAAMAIVALTVVACALIAVDYLARERFIYFWDYRGYQQIAELVKSSFDAGGLLNGFGAWRRGLDSDYSTLFALPVAAFMACLGDSRSDFILANVLIYFMPYCLACGLVAARLTTFPACDERRTTVFVLGVAAAALMPTSWAPLMRGYPDAGGAALVTFAIAILIHDPLLRKIRTPIAAGALLGLAVVFRRHFAYLVPIVIAASAIALPLTFKDQTNVSANSRRWLRYVVLLGLIAAVAALSVVALAPSFAFRSVFEPEWQKYASYKQTPAVVAADLVTNVGLALVLMAAVGYFAALKRCVAQRSGTAVLLVSLVLWCLAWISNVRQLGPHYPIAVLPLVVSTGITLGIASLWPVARLGRLVGLAVLILLSGNLALSLGYGPRISHPISSWIPSRVTPPLTRNDYPELTALVEFLADQSGPQDAILVGASSAVMNPDLLQEAHRQLIPEASVPFSVMKSPQIDSRDIAPLSALNTATIIVTAHPFQHHIGADRQRVVHAVANAPHAGGVLEGHFQRIGRVFRLGESGDVEVSVWRRATAPDLMLGAKTFAALHPLVGDEIMGRAGLYVASAPGSWGYERDSQSVYAVLSPQSPALVVFENPARRFKSRLVGNIAVIGSECTGVAMRSWLSIDGKWRSNELLRLAADTENVFDLPKAGEKEQVGLEFRHETAPSPSDSKSDGDNACTLVLRTAGE